MKHVFLWMICGMLFVQNNVLAQQNEYSHWSLDLKLGANRAEYVGGIVTKQGLGFTFGAELERTFNPLWGLALGYTYLGYSHASVDGTAHEFTGLASVNLANLVEKYRRGNWQRLNVYGRLGAGFSFYSATNNGATVVIPMGASIEYNITPRVALSLNGDRRWHMSSTMGFASAVQDRPVFWAATVGLRFKFGKKSRPHIRNTSLTNYEAPYVPSSYDDTPLQEKALSLKRADAVKDYLVEKGVEATRITTKGLADAQPIAPNTTEEGRQKNRRIEVTFLTGK